MRAFPVALAMLLAAAAVSSADGQMSMPMPEPAPAPEPMGGLNMPTPAPKGGGEEMQMEMADMEMEEMEMATSLFVFDPAVPLVLVLDVWRVESWAAYLATLLALVVWSIAHEQLAPLRAAVVATVAKPTRRESGPLGDSLTAGGAAEIVTATSNPVGASVVALLEITIGGMTCDGCSARIQGVVSAMDGVISADVQFGTGSATVVRDPQTATEASLLERVRDLGYEAATAAPSHAATADAVCYAPCGSSGKADPLNADGGSSAAAAWRQENGGMPDPYERLVQVVLLLGDDNGELLLNALQLLSSTLLMLVAMTYEVGVIAAVVIGRAFGSQRVAKRQRRRRLALNRDLARSGAEVEELDCCTS